MLKTASPSRKRSFNSGITSCLFFQRHAARAANDPPGSSSAVDSQTDAEATTTCHAWAMCSAQARTPGSVWRPKSIASLSRNRGGAPFCRRAMM